MEITNGSDPSVQFAGELIARSTRGQDSLVTWLNHYSILTVRKAGASQRLGTFSFVGIDGLLLKYLSRTVAERTSADSVIPPFLSKMPGAKVLLVGGAPGVAIAASLKIMDLHPNLAECRALDGFDELPRDESSWSRQLGYWTPDIVIVGLGAGLQEQVASQCLAAIRFADQDRTGKGFVVMTCGGYLDQVLVEQYYPSWAYPLRLNWLVRLVKEPRRLWRRYSYEAIMATLQRASVRKELKVLSGFAAYEEVFSARR